MIPLLIVGGLSVLSAGAVTAVVALSPWWLIALVVIGSLWLLAMHDVLQRRHSILRNYPVLGHFRFALESIRPEVQQYFIERDEDGRPYDRNTRSIIYERAKGIHGEKAFGTERDVSEVGYEFLLHSIHPAPQLDEPPRVHIGGPDCTKPYDMALLNVSAMSFGALSANAVLALNWGAAMGGFAQDTGEGGLTKYHLRHGGDLVWELGTGYFGARTNDGGFDAEQFADKAGHDSVRMVELKLSQGAKPGIGGVLPGAKVSAEIAEARGVPEGEKCVSPPGHKVFDTPRELVRFIARMRELAGGKPAGFKLCQRCQTNTCPVGVTTQDPKRARALVVDDKRHRVKQYQEGTVAQMLQLVAAMGLRGPEELGPEHLMRRMDHTSVRSYAQLFEWLEPGQLLAEAPESWSTDWAEADPDTFHTRRGVA